MGMSQVEFGRQYLIGRWTLCRWENEYKRPTRQQELLLALIRDDRDAVDRAVARIGSA